MSVFLISGPPGSGKTSLGSFISLHRGFVHFDLEKDDFRGAKALYADPDGEIAKLTESGDSVITWGMNPYMGRDVIRMMVDAGITPVWLDADHVATFASFMMREKHDKVMELAFFGQMTNIIQTRIDEDIMWLKVNPFDEFGKFRPIAHIADEVLAH